jgi:hypothetical protein
LFAYHYGDAPPETSWNNDRTVVTVEAGGEKSRIKFAAGSSGKTAVTVLRDGKVLAQLDKPVTQLN